MKVDTRFSLVRARDAESLVRKLNERAEEYWFTVVFCDGVNAIVDNSVTLVSAVEEDDSVESLPFNVSDNSGPQFA